MREEGPLTICTSGLWEGPLGLCTLCPSVGPRKGAQAIFPLSGVLPFVAEL